MNDLLTTFTAVTLVALVYQLVNFAKHVKELLTRARTTENVNFVFTTLVTWLLAFVVFILGAQADIANGIILLNTAPLSKLDVPSLILLALMMGSTGSLVYDTVTSRVGHNPGGTAVLVGSPTPPAPPAV